jgi:hypothetical protein
MLGEVLVRAKYIEKARSKGNCGKRKIVSLLKQHSMNRMGSALAVSFKLPTLLPAKSSRKRIQGRSVLSVCYKRGYRQKTSSLFRVFWDLAPCSHVGVNRRFRGAHCLHHQAIIAVMMAAVHTSETSVNFKVTTRHYNPVDSKLHSRRLENLKSHSFFYFQHLEFGTDKLYGHVDVCVLYFDSGVACV